MRCRFILFAIFILANSFSSKSQELKAQQELDRLHKVTADKRDSLGVSYKFYFAKIKESTDSLQNVYYQDKVDSVDKLIDLNNNVELLTEFEFIRKNLSSPISIKTLLFKIKRQESVNYHKTFDSLYNSLNPKLKNSQQGKEMQEALNNFKNSTIGEVAPDFTVKDIQKKEITLSSFRNKKYILLDFWASWCVPCRQDFSFLKEAYKSYSSKDLEIINISRDNNLEAWRKAIENDEIGLWRHFSLFENKSSVENSYFVTAIPVKVLINKEGVIIGRWRGGGEENKEAIKKLLRKTFE